MNPNLQKTDPKTVDLDSQLLRSWISQREKSILCRKSGQATNRFTNFWAWVFGSTKISDEQRVEKPPNFWININRSTGWIGRRLQLFGKVPPRAWPSRVNVVIRFSVHSSWRRRVAWCLGGGVGRVFSDGDFFFGGEKESKKWWMKMKYQIFLQHNLSW